MHPAISSAVEQLYLAFDDPTPSDIEGCPCCITMEAVSILLETPRHQITLDQIRPYARNALSTVGSTVDFRYLWPRMAELLASATSLGELDAPELLLHRLWLGQWRSWPDREQRATEQYLTALIDRLGDEPLFASDVKAWVCSVSQALEDVTPLLDRALLRETPASARNLFCLHDVNRRQIEKHGTLHGAFWDLQGTHPDGSFVNPNVALIVAWFRTPRVSAAVDRAYTAEALADGTDPLLRGE